MDINMNIQWFFTEIEKCSNYFFKNHQILDNVKDSDKRGMKKKTGGRGMEKFGSIGNGNLRGFLVMRETKM